MSYGPQTRNPWEDDQTPPEDENLFQCACGDESCIGHNNDPANIHLGNAWYAADCQMAKDIPEVVRMREIDSMNDVRRG